MCKKEKKIEKGTQIPVWVWRVERGLKIKREKSIDDEKRGDVFRSNYVLPLAACCCCCGNSIAGRQRPYS